MLTLRSAIAFAFDDIKSDQFSRLEIILLIFLTRELVSYISISYTRLKKLIILLFIIFE